jgi:hypothetical protein
MKQERVILSFIMVLIGLLVAGAAFYFYQSTKVVPASKTTLTVSPTPTPASKSNIFITISEPTDETVVGNKTLQISGKTTADATVVVITDSDQQIVQPSTLGNFSTTIILGNGENIIQIEAISPDGGAAFAQRTITYSTQDF